MDDNISQENEEITTEQTTETITESPSFYEDNEIYQEMFYTFEVEDGTSVSSDELERLYLIDIRNCIVLFMFVVFFFLFYSKLRSTITRYLS